MSTFILQIDEEGPIRMGNKSTGIPLTLTEIANVLQLAAQKLLDTRVEEWRKECGEPKDPTAGA